MAAEAPRDTLSSLGFLESGGPEEDSVMPRLLSSLSSSPGPASSSLARWTYHLMATSHRSTASRFCSRVAVAVKPSRWMEDTMCCIKWCRTG